MIMEILWGFFVKDRGREVRIRGLRVIYGEFRFGLVIGDVFLVFYIYFLVSSGDGLGIIGYDFKCLYNSRVCNFWVK